MLKNLVIAVTNIIGFVYYFVLFPNGLTLSYTYETKIATKPPIGRRYMSIKLSIIV